MTSCISRSDNGRTYESSAWFEAESGAAVRYGIARVSLGRRVELARRIREIGRKIEYLEAASDVREKLEATVLAGEIDRAYLAHLETLFARARHFAVASHDGRMIDRALALAKAHPTPFEFAMLQGVRDPLKNELVRAGHRVAEYIPYGPNWLPYFTRRLRERPRNVITMVRSFVSG